MNFAYTAYSFISSFLFFSLFPPFWFYSRISGRYSRSISQRIGLYPDRLVRAISGSPRIWMHAVSVGEVTSAIAIIESLKALMPDCAVILSTTTEHGQAFAKNKLSAGIQVKDGQELAEKAIYYLANPHKAVAIGKLAAQAVMSHKGAAGKHADVIYRLL